MNCHTHAPRERESVKLTFQGRVRGRKWSKRRTKSPEFRQAEELIYLFQ